MYEFIYNDLTTFWVNQDVGLFLEAGSHFRTRCVAVHVYTPAKASIATVGHSQPPETRRLEVITM